MAFDRRYFLAGLLACPLCAAAARADSEPHWGYDCPDGPNSWGSLDPKYRACTIGAQQSPIALDGALSTDVGDLTVDWPPEKYEIINNGHTIQAAAKTGSLKLGDRTFMLKEFHFHTPSEHAVNKVEHYDLEAHFVHENADYGLAVVGVFMRVGAANKAFSTIMRFAPTGHNEHRPLPDALDATGLLPPEKARTRYRYEGSLTIPPCSETVDWNIFAQPVSVAEGDFNKFKGLYSNNARPLQSLNRRFLLKG